MLQPAVRPRPALLVLLVLAPLLGAGCQGSGGDDQGSGFRITFTTGPPSAQAEVVYLRLHDAGGSLVTLDIVGRNVTPALDGLDLVLAFDPAIVEAWSASDVTFLGTCGLTRPDNSILLCADSIASGSANTSGVLLFSAAPQGASPAPVPILGDVVLASVTFRARSRGASPVYFHAAGNPSPSGSFSRVTSASDPAGASAVSFDPGTAGVAEIEVRR